MAGPYPGLLPRLQRLIANRCAAALALGRRFGRDRASLAELLGAAPGDLVSARFGAGDSHRGGHTVAIVRCGAGSLVYKPRSVLVDAALGRLLPRLLPDQPAGDRIRVPAVLPCRDRVDEYGWAAHVPHRYCADDHELRFFYQGLGHWLAVMRLLGGSDLHSENLIACGRQPVVVAEAVAFARARQLPFALRSGGHSFADFSTTDGLLIDLGGMDSVRLDGTAVTVGPGTRISVLAGQLAEHDRMVPCGWCPTVAVASVLGGGYGMLGRFYGLGCDQLLAAQVVLADGRTVWVDRAREPDLFWALRGAGSGSFGVVTALVLRTFPAPRVTTFVHRCRWSDVVRVIDAWQHWAPDAPDEINAELVLQAAEPGSEPRVTLFGAVVGQAADARQWVEDLIARAAPGEDLEELAELSARAAARRHTYAGLPVPDRLPPAPPAGQRPWLRAVKSEFVDRPLPVAAIRALAEAFPAGLARGQYRELELVPWRGAYRRVSPEATAFVHRTPRFMIGHHGIVQSGATDQERIAVRVWAERSWRTVHPWASGSIYPNYPDRDLVGWARAYYGANLERLMRVKDRYDPDDVFRFAQIGSPHPPPSRPIEGESGW